MSRSSLKSTVRDTLPKKSALGAKYTVNHHFGMGRNSNQLKYQIVLVFASESKILNTVIYCRGHSFVLWN